MPAKKNRSGKTKAMKREDKAQAARNRAEESLARIGSVDGGVFSSTDVFVLGMEGFMDPESNLPKIFLKMPLLDSISAVALSKKVIDDWHWGSVQQEHLIRRLEQPDIEIGCHEEGCLWAVVVNYAAFDVASWLVARGYKPDGNIPPDKQEWAPWVTQSLRTEGDPCIPLSYMVRELKSRGYI